MARACETTERTPGGGGGPSQSDLDGEARERLQDELDGDAVAEARELVADDRPAYDADPDSEVVVGRQVPCLGQGQINELGPHDWQRIDDDDVEGD